MWQAGRDQKHHEKEATEADQAQTLLAPDRADSQDCGFNPG
jgi:hypothetical protein